MICFSKAVPVIFGFLCFVNVMTTCKAYITFFVLVIAVWGIAIAAVAIISLLSIIGIMIVPLMKHSVHFNRLLSFLIALAVGTLVGDALLHLLPHVSIKTCNNSYFIQLCKNPDIKLCHNIHYKLGKELLIVKQGIRCKSFAAIGFEFTTDWSSLKTLLSELQCQVGMGIFFGNNRIFYSFDALKLNVYK